MSVPSHREIMSAMLMWEMTRCCKTDCWARKLMIRLSARVVLWWQIRLPVIVGALLVGIAHVFLTLTESSSQSTGEVAVAAARTWRIGA